MRALRSGILAAGVLALAGCAAAEPQYDVVIRNGTIYDGTGGEPVRADLAIVGDSIVAVGKLGDARAHQEVDAQGMAVAPGFINMLSWSNESLIADPRSQSELREGVTLEVMGEGESMGPLSDSMKVIARAQQGDIKYPIEWTSLGQYFEWLEKRGISTNVASFVGAATVREHEVGWDDRAPTAAELARMRQLVDQAMEEGAMGVGSALIYSPANYAKTDELIALVQEAGRYGGMYISHMRSEGDQENAAIDELLRIAREAHVPAEIYHLKVAGKDNWPKEDAVLAKIDSARKAGLQITADMYTYGAGAAGLDATMPPWAQSGGLEAWRQRLRVPAVRARVIAEMKQKHPGGWESLYQLSGGPDGLIEVAFKQDSLKYLTGKTVAQIAQLWKESPEDAMIDLVLKDDSRVGTVFFIASEENLRKQVVKPWVSFCSDEASAAPEGVFLKSMPHPRAYGSFVRVLGKYTRDEKVLTLAQAVRKLAGLPAATLKLHRRGLLRPGYFADVVVFDPRTIQDHATYESPRQYSTGVRDVFVNGVAVIRDGVHTGAKPGRFVRGPGWTGWTKTPGAGKA
ncbi:MAG TPA: D-aminoacylase [Myxococcales bacterium]|nr:D-aminoacylase [Myxococcales bacterium]